MARRLHLSQLSLLFTILPVIVSFASCIITRIAHEDWLLRLALGLQLGGAVIWSTASFGHVTDFVSWQFRCLNVADAASLPVLPCCCWISDQRTARKARSRKSLQETLGRGQPMTPASSAWSASYLLNKIPSAWINSW
jgi:hypothetical protein